MQLQFGIGSTECDICVCEGMPHNNCVICCFRHKSGQLVDQLIVGAVDRLNIYLMYQNDGEDAFNSYIEFALPRQYFQHYDVFPLSVSHELCYTDYDGTHRGL